MPHAVNNRADQTPSATEDLVNSLLGEFDCVSTSETVVTPAEHMSRSLDSGNVHTGSGQKSSSRAAIHEWSGSACMWMMGASSATGCVGRCNLTDTSASPHFSFASFRELVPRAEVATYVSDLHLIKDHVASGVADNTADHEWGDQKSKLKRGLAMHCRLFPDATLVTHDPDPNIIAFRKACIKLGIEDYLLPLFFADADFDAWRVKHGFCYGLDGLYSHLGQGYPSWSWEMVRRCSFSSCAWLGGRVTAPHSMCITSGHSSIHSPTDRVC